MFPEGRAPINPGGERLGAVCLMMPLPRRRSSFLGQPSSERPAAASACGRIGVPGTNAPRGVFVGPAPMAAGGASCLGTRVSRRALGISSVFLQGMRSSSAPVLPRAGAGTRQHGGGMAAGLNGCLMEYRDKVRALETLNQQLEEQIRLCLDRKANSAGAWGPLRAEWEDVYRQVSEAILNNARLMLQTENVQANAEDFKERFESEQPFRRAVEEEISSLYKVMEDAELTRVELEQQMEKMREELRSLELGHEQDVRVLYRQMGGGRDVDEPDAPIETSLDQILAFIRSHWEKVTERNRADTDSCLECRESECVSRSLSPEDQQLESLKAECNEAGCKIQSLQAETESIRALKRGLESSLGDARHWHAVELQNLVSVVARLEAELTEVHAEMEQQRRDYDTLLSNKQRLEQEIAMYHGVLDGEESRLQPPDTLCPGGTPETKGAPGASAGSRTAAPAAPGSPAP